MSGHKLGFISSSPTSHEVYYKWEKEIAKSGKSLFSISPSLSRGGVEVHITAYCSFGGCVDFLSSLFRLDPLTT